MKSFKDSLPRKNTFPAFFTLGLLTVVLITVFSTGVFAEEPAAGIHHEKGIPRVVFYQALNFFGLLGILFYLVRKKVSSFFVERHELLTAALTEAKRVREEAEKTHQEYTVKIQNLEQEASHFLEQIKKEGLESKNRMIADAKAMVASIEQEAKRSAQNEIEKAKLELYEDMLQNSLEGARGLLQKSIIETDQKRLQQEFVEKVEAVR